MTDQNTFLERIIKALNHAGIAYMISGSIGSSFHGQPRATNDADIVIDPNHQQLLALIESLGPDCYVSKEAALQALTNNSMFNIIDIQSGFKADMVICKKRPFSRQEFARRMRVTFPGFEVYVLSPEDSILSKLEWSKNSQSQLQFNDALGILTVQKNKLDFDYLKHWAGQLDIEDALNRLIREADK
jgi:hypothetical protein